MAGVDINRSTSGISLPPQVSAEIWSDVQEQSAAMRMARQIPLPGSGITVPIITGDPTADWVDETDEITVSRSTFGNKQMTPYKLAVIEPISKEFTRDLPGLYAELRRRLPGTLAKKFDSTVFGTSAPGSNFDTLGGATAVALSPGSGASKNTYSGLVKAYTTVANAGTGAALNGWALSSQGKGLLLGQVDTQGRPLLFSDIQGGSPVSQLLGEPVYYTQGVYTSGTPNVIGFAGDWSTAAYGTVQGIQFDINDRGSITDGTKTIDAAVTSGAAGETVTVDVPNILNLWQREMVAIKVVVEIGFRVRDATRFVKLTDATIS